MNTGVKKSLTKMEKVPFRYDIVGSFLRPSQLATAREAFRSGNISAEQLRSTEDGYIQKLVEKEIAVGLKSVTDGEFRRSYWHLDFFWGFDGISHVVMDRGYVFHDEETRPDSARLTGKLRFTGHPFLEDYRFLHALAGNDVLARQTIPAPAQLYAELARGENALALDTIYPDREELYHDISAAYREAIIAFYELGCRNIQLDDCTWGMLCDTNYRTRLGEEQAVRLAELYVRLNNAAIAGLPDDLTVTTHICRGNFHSTWASSGGYEPVAEILFGEENVGAFYLEFDDERSGDFAPLRYLPENKMAVLGLITSKNGTMENKGRVMRRIEDAAEYVPIERLCLSTQCGFASTEEGNKLTEDQQWDKVRLVKEIAGEVWQE